MSPTSSTFFASAGKSQYVVRPIRRLPAPTANTISVKLGASETTLSTWGGSEMRRPASSVISRFPDEIPDDVEVEREQAKVESRMSAMMARSIPDGNLVFPDDSKNTKPTDLRSSTRKTGFSGTLDSNPGAA